MRLSRGFATACLPVMMLIASFAICAAPALSLSDEVEVIFDFTPAKASYAPNESFAITFTVRDVLLNGTGAPNEIKVTNLSAQFTWMGPGVWTKESVSSESVWLYPNEFGIYRLNLSVPANAPSQTYSYVLKVEYQWMSAWGVIDHIEWTSVTFHDFVVAPETIIPPHGVDVIFDFTPAKASYAPNESFEITFTVRDILLNGTGAPNEIKVTNISAQFTWMGTAEWTKESVSNESVWLYPNEFGIYRLNLTVPANATTQTYSYVLKVEYQWLSAYGVIDREWTSPTYHDFVVAPPDHEKFDYVPYIGVMALVLAIGSIGALMYHRRSEKDSKDQTPVANDVGAMGVAEVPSTATYPVIHAAAGEHFPIERGFIYLVKEKRPNIAFAVFNEAVSHGAKGMLVVREHPNRLRQTHSFNATKILWLTRRVGVDHIDPTELSLLSLEITKFVGTAQKSVVLLEGIEYIITQNDFESVLRFVNHLHDFVLAHDSAVIIVIDPRVLSTRELALLERSGRVVEPAEVPNGKIDKLADELEA